MDIFQKRQKEFHKDTSLFNLLYFSAKRKAMENNTIVNASLNDKFVKEFISFSFDSITSNYTLEDIRSKFPDAIEISEEEIETYKEDFYAKKPILRFRGKYEFEFMLKYINFIIDDANKTKSILNKKTKFRIDPAIALSQLSQYAETSSSLREFLQTCA